MSRLLSLSMALRYRNDLYKSIDSRNDERVFKNILQGRYAAALFSAANKNGSLDAVEKVGSFDRRPLFLSVKQAYLMSSFFFCRVPLLIA